jgi:LPS-assembly protein
VRTYQAFFIIFFLILNQPLIVYGKDEFAICKPISEIAPPRPNLPPLNGDSLRLTADNVLVDERQGHSTFSGDVFMQRGEQILKTPKILYDRNTDTATTEGDFIFWDRNFIVSGSKISLHPDDQGEMSQAAYWLLARRARGQAEKLIKSSKDIVQLEQASYTTCDPNKEVWRLDAQSVTLNNADEVGTAHHVIIRLFNFPVFYTPYLSFPLTNARKSGFLPPNVGTSDETGTEISIPYYLNLAPHYDATVTPRIMSRRGLLVQTEFRYLTQQTGGELQVEYMPHDQAFGADRGSLGFKHQGPISARWITDINVNYASDQRYFEELGNNIAVASVTHLERRADLAYIGDGWIGLARLQGFQTLDSNPLARPYQRLPQLLLKTYLPEKNRKLNYGLEAELVHFERDTGVIDAPIGNRVDVKPVISYPWRDSGTFLIPKLSLRYTLYNLTHVADNEENNPQRLLFTFSTDTGLFLERQVQWFNTELLHTLEPRLFYRYTPYEDQSDIPIFDTAEYDFSFGQLFRENTFTGADRVDDGHQVTLALTSRLLGSKTAMEHLRASIGQVFYFRDRKVTLPSQPLGTDESSSIIVEMASQLAQALNISSTWRWNAQDNDTEQAVFRMRYHPDAERIFNFSYRVRDSLSLEQTDMSVYWNLGSRWNVLGRWNYSLPQEKTLETFFGLEYSSCCWAIRGITRRYLNNVDGFSYLNGFFLQFQLKGLGGFGRKADSFLEQRIPGYHDRF